MSIILVDENDDALLNLACLIPKSPIDLDTARIPSSRLLITIPPHRNIRSRSEGTYVYVRVLRSMVLLV